jgi:hypothetical protein
MPTPSPTPGPTPSPNPEPTASKGNATEVHIQLNVCRLRQICYGGCANAPATWSLDSTYRFDSIGVAFALDCYRLVVKSARSVDIAKGSFVVRRLSGVDICSPLADLARARRPNHVSGWQGTRLVGFQPQAMDQATPYCRSSSATRI